MELLWLLVLVRSGVAGYIGPRFNNTAPSETYQPGLSYHTDTWMAVNLSHSTICCPSQPLSHTLLADNIQPMSGI